MIKISSIFFKNFYQWGYTGLEFWKRKFATGVIIPAAITTTDTVSHTQRDTVMHCFSKNTLIQ